MNAPDNDQVRSKIAAFFKEAPADEVLQVLRGFAEEKPELAAEIIAELKATATP